MSNDEWKRITDDAATLPGPEAVLLSGYDPDQLPPIRALLDDLGHAEIPLRTVAKGALDTAVEDILSRECTEPPAGQGALPMTLVISGLPIQAVHHLMDRFRETGLPRPIFATATATNLRFTAKELLRHLLQEQQMVREMAKKR